MLLNLPKEDVEIVRKSAELLYNKRVVLTGSRGFLGRWLVEALEPVCNLIKFDIIDGFDITDSEKVDTIEQCSFIIHAAGNASPRVYQSRPFETIDVTVNGTRNLLNLAEINKARMVFLSSSEIYGDPSVVPTPEWYKGNVDCRGPRACYDESKRLAETMCQLFYEMYDCHVVTVRPFNVYGPGMNIDDGRAIPNFVRSLMENRPITLYGDGKPTRTYCYITDALRGILAALQFGRAGRVYNIGTDLPEISSLTLAAMITEFANKPKYEIENICYPDEYPAGEPQRRCPDISRAKTELNYEPQIDLNTGLRKTLSWAGIIP